MTKVCYWLSVISVIENDEINTLVTRTKFPHLFLVGEKFQTFATCTLCCIYCLPVMDNLLRMPPDFPHEPGERPAWQCNGVLDTSHFLHGPTSKCKR